MASDSLRLPDLDQLAVRVSHVATKLGAPVDRGREELGAFGAPLGDGGLDVGHANVHEAGDGPRIARRLHTGRLMRAHGSKTSVRVYDYADVRVPVLRAMHARRLATYKTLGFTRERSPIVGSAPQLAVPILDV